MTALIPFAGAAPGLPAISRRSLLRASPALLAPVALTACVTEVLSAPADPHPRLLADWRSNLTAWLATSAEDDDPEAEALWQERRRLGDLIRSTPATSLAGLLAQMEYLRLEYGDHYLDLTENKMINDVPLPFLDSIIAGLRAL